MILSSLSFWLTRNLFMVVGVHTLVNIPMLLWKSDYAQVSMLGTLLLLVILLPLIRGISRRQKSCLRSLEQAGGDSSYSGEYRR